MKEPIKSIVVCSDSTFTGTLHRKDCSTCNFHVEAKPLECSHPKKNTEWFNLAAMSECWTVKVFDKKKMTGIELSKKFH